MTIPSFTAGLDPDAPMRIALCDVVLYLYHRGMVTHPEYLGPVKMPAFFDDLVPPDAKHQHLRTRFARNSTVTYYLAEHQHRVGLSLVLRDEQEPRLRFSTQEYKNGKKNFPGFEQVKRLSDSPLLHQPSRGEEIHSSFHDFVPTDPALGFDKIKVMADSLVELSYRLFSGDAVSISFLREGFDLYHRLPKKGEE
jgi:hypothetical protein